MTYNATFNGLFMATKEGLLWKVNGDLLRDGEVGQQHKLFNQPVRVALSIVVAVDWRPILIKAEH